jgi:hypothetical protein
VRNAYLVENGPFSPEPQPLVEAHGVGLCVKVYLREPQFCGLVHEMDNDGCTDPPMTVDREHRDSPDLAGGRQPPGARKFASGGECESVPA